MKKYFIFNRLKYVLLILTILFGPLSTANCNDLTQLESVIISRINLINQIIKYPKEANMKNWILLGNPHDESELKFYMNSISDGTSSAYERKKMTMEQLIRHSRSKSENEPSTILVFMRLALMAYNIRSGDNSPYLNFVALVQSNSNEIIAECNFKILNAGGIQIEKKAEVFFDLGDNLYKDIFLQRISLDGRIVFGGWNAK